MAEETKTKVVFLHSPKYEQQSLDHEFKVLGRILSFKFEVSSVDNLQLISPDEIVVISSALETF